MAELLHYETPDRTNFVPPALRVVAWLFIAYGIWAGLTIVWSLLHGRIYINLGVLCFFAGRGLLNRRRGWRIFALVVLWLGMIGGGIAIGALVLKGSPTAGVGPGSASGASGMIVIIAILLLMLAVCIWSYWVLMRGDVRSLFYPPSHTKTELAAAAERLRDVR